MLCKVSKHCSGSVTIWVMRTRPDLGRRFLRRRLKSIFCQLWRLMNSKSQKSKKVSTNSMINLTKMSRNTGILFIKMKKMITRLWKKWIDNPMILRIDWDPSKLLLEIRKPKRLRISLRNLLITSIKHLNHCRYKKRNYKIRYQIDTIKQTNGRENKTMLESRRKSR